MLARLLAGGLVVVVVTAVIAGPSVVGALTRPGTDPVAARLAEWARDHGLGSVVTWLEARRYAMNRPAVGGTPAGGIPTAATAPGVALPPAPAGSRVGLPEPLPIPPPAGLVPLPGEGRWQTVVSTAQGAAVRVASVRSDAAHTSYLAGVMWMDPTFVRGMLHPGTQDPGGSWSAPSWIDPTEQRSVAAAFNAGFRLQGDSHGGWYAEGQTARPLVAGAASLVLRRDGTADVGVWGTEVRMTPDVVSVRQNLVPLVDHGVVNPTCASGGPEQWGVTIGQAAAIDRSAFGVTADGAEVYVGGHALSVCALGALLRSAGVVRGMELDINPAWVSGTYFHPTGGPGPDGYRLFPGERIGPQHYFAPSTRDFFSFDLRPARAR